MVVRRPLAHCLEASHHCPRFGRKRTSAALTDDVRIAPVSSASLVQSPNFDGRRPQNRIMTPGLTLDARCDRTGGGRGDRSRSRAAPRANKQGRGAVLGERLWSALASLALRHTDRPNKLPEEDIVGWCATAFIASVADDAFGANVDLRHAREAVRHARHHGAISPPEECCGMVKRAVCGNSEEKHISTRVL